MKRIYIIITLIFLSLPVLRAAEHNRVVCRGGDVTLTADVTSDFYQWYCDGVVIPGENSQTLVLSDLTVGHTYSVSSRESYPTIKSNMFDNGGFEDQSKMAAMRSDYNYKGWELTDIYGSGGLSGQSNLWVISKNGNTTWHDYLPVTACQGTHFVLYDAGASGRAWYAKTENNPNLKIEAGKKYYFSYSAVNINPHIYSNTATRAYSANPDNWSTVYCYIWDSSTSEKITDNWPGTQMTYNAAGKFWYYDIPSGKTWNSNWMVIYNCGSSSCQTGNETYMDYRHASDLQKELDSHPARLVFNVKDRTTDTEYPLDVLDLACTSSDPSSHTWQHRQATFVSPVTSNNVEVNVYNTTNIAGNGNDFGLDSLMFQLEDWSSTRPVDSTVFHVAVPNLHVNMLRMDTACVTNPNFFVQCVSNLDAATYDVTFSASKFGPQNATGVPMPADGKFYFNMPAGWNSNNTSATFRFHDASNTCSNDTTIELRFQKKPEMTFSIPATVAQNEDYLNITYKGKYFLTATIDFGGGWTQSFSESQIEHDGNTHTLAIPIAGRPAGDYTPSIHLSSIYCDLTLTMPSFTIIEAVNITTMPVGTGADHIICSDVSAFSVPFVTSGGAVNYSMLFSSPLFTAVSSAVLPTTGNFIITVPDNTPAGPYSAYIKVWDETATSFDYDTVRFTLADRPDYVMGDPAGVICSSDGSFTLSKVSGSVAPTKYSLSFDDAHFTAVDKADWPASNQIEVVVPTTLPEGTHNYNITITFYDASLACPMAEQHLPFTVASSPAVTLTEIADHTNVCSTDATMEVHYVTSGSPTHYSAKILRTDMTPVRSFSTVSVSAAEGDWDFDVSGLAAGNYILSVTVMSDALGTCPFTGTIPFSIAEQPAMTFTPAAANIAQTAGGLDVNYATTAGKAVSYSIAISGPTPVPTHSGVVDGSGSGSFHMTLPNPLAAGIYTATVTIAGENTCSNTTTFSWTVVGDQGIAFSAASYPVCAGTMTVAMPYSVVGGAPAKYKLSVSPAGSGISNVTTYTALPADMFTFNTSAAAPGTYTLSVTVCDATETVSSTASTQLVVVAIPNPVFTDIAAPVCADEAEVVITVPSTVAPADYILSVSGPSTFAPVTTYTPWPASGVFSLAVPASVVAGNYMAHFTYRDGVSGACGDEGDVHFTIAATPKASFSVVPFCEQQTNLQIAASGVSGAFPVAYSFVLGGKTYTGSLTSASQSLTLPLQSVLAPGTYNTTVNLTDANSCHSTASLSLIVLARASFSLSMAERCCVGTESVAMNYSAISGAATYSYELKNASSAVVASATDVTVSGTTMAVNLPTATLPVGTYTLRVWMTSAEGCESVEQTATLVVDPVPTMTLMVPATVSADSTAIHMTYSSTNAVDYTLNMGSGWTQSGSLSATGTISLPLAGYPADTYTGTLKYRSAHCEEEISVSFRIVGSIDLVMDESLIGNHGVVCSDAATVEMPITTVTGATRYSMSFDPSTVFAAVTNAAIPSGAFSVPVPVNAPAGMYTVYLTVWDATETSYARDTLHFTLAARPDYVMAAPSAVVCSADGVVQLTKTSGAVAPTAYSLSFDDAHFTAVDHAAWPASNTIEIAIPSGLTAGTHTYTATLTLYDASNTCAMSAQTLTFKVASTPTLTLTRKIGETDICSTDDAMTVLYSTTGAPAYYRAEMLRTDMSVARTYAETALADASGEWTFNVAGLSAGDYLLRVTALSDLSGSCSVSETITWSIAEQPAMTFTPAAANIAQTAGGLDVNYATTAGKAVSYSIAISGPTPVPTHSGVVDCSGSGSFHMTLPNPLAAGIYTATVTIAGENTCSNTTTFSWTVVGDQGIAFSAASYPVCAGTMTVDMPYSVVGGAPAKYKLSVSPAGSGISNVTTYTALPADMFTFNTSAAAPGTYTLSVTVCDATETVSSTASTQLVVVAIPNPVFTDIAAPVCADEAEVVITVPSTVAPADYILSVAGPSTFAPVSSYTPWPASGVFSLTVPTSVVAGNYTAHFTYRDGVSGACGDEGDVHFTIAATPQASFSVVPFCEQVTNLQIAASGVSGAFPVAYSFVLGGKTYTGSLTSASQSLTLPLQSVLTPGTYNTTVTLTDANSCHSTASLSLTVLARASFSLSMAERCCVGTESVAMNYSAISGAATYSYELKNASSAVVASATDVAVSGTTMAVNLPTATLPVGTYTLRVWMTSAEGCESVEQTATLVVDPVPTMTLTVPTTVSADSTAIHMTYSSTNAVDYTLNMGSGWTQSGSLSATGTISLPLAGHAAGTYTGTLKYRSAHCEEEISVSFRIVGSIDLVMDESLIGNNGVVCSDAATVEIPISSVTGATRYSMSFNAVFADITDAAIPTGSFSVPVPANAPAGDYTATITVWDATATSYATATVHFTLAARPDYVMAAPSAVVCSTDGVVQFTKTSGAIAPSAYSLSFDDAHFTAVDHAAWPASNTVEIAIPSGLTAGTHTYTATLTLYDASNTCAMSAQTLTFKVASTPTLTLTKIAGETDICQTASQMRVAYEVSGAPTAFLAEILRKDGTQVRSTTGAIIAAQDTLAMSVAGLPTDTFTLRMTAMNDGAGSCTDVQEISFSIAPMPTMTFAPQDDSDTITTHTGSLEVDYQVTAGKAVSFEITFSGPSPIPAQSGTVSASGTGTFHVSLPTQLDPGTYTATVSIVGLNTCETSTTFHWYVAPDAPSFSISIASDLCSGDSILSVAIQSLQGTPAAYSYRVENAGGVVAQADNQPWPGQNQISLHLNGITADNYTLTMTAVSTLGAVSDEQQATFQVVQTPEVSITMLKPVCSQADEVVLEFTQSYAASYSLELIATNGQTVFAQPMTPMASSPITFYPSPLAVGQYKLVLTVYDASAHCSSTVEKTLKVQAPPVVKVDMDQIVCFDEGATEFALSYTTISGQPGSFEAEVRSTETGAVFTQARTPLTGMLSLDLGVRLAEGSYDLTVRFFDAQLACEVESEALMYVASDTIVYAKWNDFLFCANGDDRFVSYQWYHDGEPVAGQTGQYITGDLSTGEYYVEATTVAGKKIFSCPSLFVNVPRSAELNPGTPTGRVRKFIREGRLYIEVDGAEYSGTGAQTK